MRITVRKNIDFEMPGEPVNIFQSVCALQEFEIDVHCKDDADQLELYSFGELDDGSTLEIPETHNVMRVNPLTLTIAKRHSFVDPDVTSVLKLTQVMKDDVLLDVVLGEFGTPRVGGLFVVETAGRHYADTLETFGVAQVNADLLLKINLSTAKIERRGSRHLKVDGIIAIVRKSARVNHG